MAAQARTQASEMWIPRCPHCGSGTLLLAPANGFTKFLTTKTEVYCSNCQYRAVLADDIKRIYIRS
jgi:ribosomal protein S27AE